MCKPRYLDRVVYGEDYVLLGPWAGGEATTAQVCEDFWFKDTDFYNTYLGDIPLMASREVDSLDDVTVHVDNLAANVDQNVRQVMPRAENYIMGGILGMFAFRIMPFYASGDCKGVLISLGGAAGFEYLTRIPATATLSMSSISTTHLYAIVCFVIGNVLYWMRRMRAKT
jgi:hypothetical protein